MYFICNTLYYTWRQNYVEKYYKISNKIYKHLVQQIVQQKVQQKVKQKLQQKVHNNYVVPLVKQSVFTKLGKSLY